MKAKCIGKGRAGLVKAGASKEQLEQFSLLDKLHTARCLLYIHGLLSDAENDKAKQRWVKKVDAFYADVEKKLGVVTDRTKK